MDFLTIATRCPKRGVVEIYPEFILKKSSDLMIRGGDFYAVWVEELGLWSTEELDCLYLIDRELDKYAKENRDRFEGTVKVLHMRTSSNGMIDSWHKYCQKRMRDNFHMLDEKLIFANTETRKKDYASRRLPYPLEDGEPSAWNRLTSVLYSEAERKKIEWAIGSIVTGDSQKIQKFMVFYGAAGTGKSTILTVIERLFEGYTSVFDAMALGSANNSFALEAFKTNPLVAIQHDGDLSHIEDNTRLNSLVSHEIMTVNEKFKSTYSNRFKCFLFMGTNKPVKITDAKSGLMRRLIDVVPTGEKIPIKEYRALVKQTEFELGMIAAKCRDAYLSDPGAYDDYIPINMLGASNDFYNFIMDSWYVFKRENRTTLKAAWEMYKTYCEDAKVNYPYSQRVFKEELKNYFKEYCERMTNEDGTRVRNYYGGFKSDKFENGEKDESGAKDNRHIVDLKNQASIFDRDYAGIPAQYATDKGVPRREWDGVKTTLGDLDTHKVHYVRLPENHIVIDFDIQDKDGNKCLEKNLEEASKWPPTYTELSKSGQGVHLHYIYTGDVSKLSRVYADHVEVKIFTGNSALRRKLTMCNNLPIASISSGLPLKEGVKTVSFEGIKNERGLRTLIKRHLDKEIMGATKPSVDMIYKILEEAYASGLSYDVSDMRNAVLGFAAGSTHQSDICIKLVGKMKFKGEETTSSGSAEPPSPEGNAKEDLLVFFDIEVYPNLLLVIWKAKGEGKPLIRMFNPTPEEIERLIRMKLIGFNCRRYDNHILYARLMGYTNEQIYNLSRRIIEGDRTAFFGEAYNISYTDVYDFSSSINKKSLKKWEIELGIHHQEMGLPWDKPVPEELWTKVAEYCDNDVLATEAVFDHLSGDWTARRILADVAGMSVNDTTNSLTTRIIFGRDRNPQKAFNYRNLAEPVAA